MSFGLSMIESNPDIKLSPTMLVAQNLVIFITPLLLTLPLPFFFFFVVKRSKVASIISGLFPILVLGCYALAFFMIVLSGSSS